MMTDAQRDAWFTYHAPTDETAPKYAAIREATEACAAIVQLAVSAVEDTTQRRYSAINDACRDLAIVIDDVAPDSVDKSAAIRCVRLARNAANEAIGRMTMNESVRLLVIADEELIKARWQANSAIACAGV